MELIDYDDFQSNQSALAKYIKARINEAIAEKDSMLYKTRCNIIKSWAEGFAIAFAKSHPETYSDEVELLSVNADITISVFNKMGRYSTYELHDGYVQYDKSKKYERILGALLLPVNHLFTPILWNVNIVASKKVRRAALTAFFMTVLDYYRSLELAADSEINNYRVNRSPKLNRVQKLSKSETNMFDGFLYRASLVKSNKEKAKKRDNLDFEQIFFASFLTSITASIFIVSVINVVTVSFFTFVASFLVIMLTASFINDHCD